MKYITIILLLTSIVLGQIPKYDRGYFKHWIDVDKDCQSTRTEVLIEESKSDVVYKNSDSCEVTYGIWYDVYSDTIIFNSKGIDVDHFVPLKNAWESGAWKWIPEEREEYANYLEDPNHLIAVSFSSNRSKGAKSPDQWLPKNKDYRVEYCKIWCDIKVKWNLSVTYPEFIMLKHILKYEIVIYPIVRYE